MFFFCFLFEKSHTALQNAVQQSVSYEHIMICVVCGMVLNTSDRLWDINDILIFINQPIFLKVFQHISTHMKETHTHATLNE